MRVYTNSKNYPPRECMNDDIKMIVDAIVTTRGRNGLPEWAKISDVYTLLLSKKCTPAEVRAKIGEAEDRGYIKRLNHCIAVRESPMRSDERHIVRNCMKAAK